MKLIKTLLNFALISFILSMPLQLGIIAYEPTWGKGFLNNFITSKATLSDAILAFATILLLIQNVVFKHPIKTGQKTYFQAILAVLSMTILSLVISPYQDSTWHFLLGTKLLELLVLYLLIQNANLTKEKIIKTFAIMLSICSILATLQVLLQTDFSLQILGEPILTKETPNLAKFAISNLEIIRGYATFPHPNVLGGFLAIGILSTLLYLKRTTTRAILLIFQTLGLFATFSKTAILAVALGLATLSTYSFALPIILIMIALALLFLGGTPWTNPTVLERLHGFSQSLKMIMENPLGVGFESYTLFIEKVETTSLKPWEYQPVHNFILLLTAETGLTGLIIFLASGAKVLLKKPPVAILLALIVLSLTDHYLLSLEQGRYLLVFTISLFALDNLHHPQTDQTNRSHHK